MTFTPAPKPKPMEKRPPRPPKAKNATRAASEFTRTYHSEERVMWVQSLPCVVQPCSHPSENVHVEGDGAGRRAGYESVVPMCRSHHRELHRVGVTEFEGTFYVALAEMALETERAWRRYAAHAVPSAVEGER